MPKERNYKQSEKTAFRMGEHNSKWSNWQIINLQNIQAAHAAQYQKNKQPNKKKSKWNYRWRINLQNIQAAHAIQYQKNEQPNQKWVKELKDISPKKTYRWLVNTWKDAQHHSFYQKNANQNHNEVPSYAGQNGCHQKVYKQ